MNFFQFNYFYSLKNFLGSWLTFIRGSVWILALIPLSVLSLIAVFTHLYFAPDISSRERIMNRKDTGVILMDQNNTPFFTLYEARQKTFIPLSEIPEQTKQAVIAVEDDDFYLHQGFSIRGIVRSLVTDVKLGQAKQGGSTITQQLVKNSILTSGKSFLRKYQEILLSERIEVNYSKDEILEMYLNSVYFGSGAFGIEEAAEAYFNKPAKKLTLAESAYLAGLLPSPSKYSPFNGNGDKAKSRQLYTLSRMQDAGYINQEEKEEAQKIPVEFERGEDEMNDLAPHFAMMVRDELNKMYGEEKVTRSGYKVRTTINLEWQEYAEKVVADHVQKISGNQVSNGAAVVIDPENGQILSLVGSKDWRTEGFGKVNVATAKRQPGSSFKPIVYAAAFEKGVITPSTVLKDEPTTYQANRWSQAYTPRNYDSKFRGPVLPRRALANSLNVPSVQVLSKLGMPEALEMAKRLGITSLNDPSKYGLSLVLGAGEVSLIEMTGAYATFANDGVYNPPITILEIYDKHNQKIYQQEAKPKKVLDKKYTFLISSILSDNNARQEIFGGALTNSKGAAVKTGTTSDYKDSWTLGYTNDLTVGVWVGNNDGAPMNNIAGSLGAAPIFKSLIEKFATAANFIPPDGLIKLAICRHNGLRSKEATSSAYTEYFIKGSEPKGVCYAPPPNPSPQPPDQKDKDKEKKD
ncbi:MAG: PBP1A family penicillin-binding protein [Candidatus Daviesbacteria bacterium]|nr:PBP1A family penicillin-binding protein [Candidatus Daviesbacteria bacterium]